MIINGTQIADELLKEAHEEVVRLGRMPVVRAVTVAPNAATESYLRVKSKRAADAGMQLDIVRLPDNATTADVVKAIGEPGADAVIVQLPLPDSIHTQEVLDAIPVEKDADVLSRAAREAFENGKERALLPPVADAMKEILLRGGVDPKGKNAVVIGSGWLVGMPAATWLRQAGANVSILTRESGDISQALTSADIIVSGAGAANLITPEMLNQGVTLIDAGTSESNGTLAGDADPACAEVASVFTPVPGGVGPIAVACLFRNVAKLLKI
jgi:methylenetetrahydrofolate dehydrogenase (NADP+)/methenyltetrahydrofolate cyclohydrolase